MTKIELYPIRDQQALNIVPAQKQRDWMTPYAYRCLPIVAANSFGWDIVLTEPVHFHWNGKDEVKDVTVIHGGSGCHSNFGVGSVTFPVGYSWKTEPGVHLMVAPPINERDVFFHTISAVIETDTLQYPWFLTIRAVRPGDTTIMAGTVLARVYPVRMADVAEATITEAHEPEDFRLAREQHTRDRDAGKAESKWLRFYRKRTNFHGMRAPEVEPLDSGVTLSDNGILAQGGWLTREECAIIADYIKVAPSRPQSESLWDGRTYNFKEGVFPPELYKKLTKDVHDAVCAFYHKTEMVMEHPHLVRWSEGHDMRPHSDYAQGRFPTREYAVLIYLTDDYDGGNIWFPALNLELRPEAGSLVAFRGGTLFHGVKKVTRGDRLTCITWLHDVSTPEAKAINDAEKADYIVRMTWP